MSRTRPIRSADAAPIAELMRVNRAFYERWIPARPEPYYTEDGQRDAIRQQLDAEACGLAISRVIVDGEQIVGRISLTGIVRDGLDAGTLGYSITESRAGRGWVAEAVGEVCAIAFSELGLHRVDAGTIAANRASQRVLERSGFTHIGVAPRYVRVAGCWRDAVLYQRLA